MHLADLESSRSWKNIPMMAIMANRPLASSADNLLGLLLRVGGSQDLEAIVTRGASLVVIEATAELNKAKVGSNLSPSSNWHLGNCCKSVGDVSKLQASGWRQEAWPQLKRFAKIEHACNKFEQVMSWNLQGICSTKSEIAETSTACQRLLEWYILANKWYDRSDAIATTKQSNNECNSNRPSAKGRFNLWSVQSSKVNHEWNESIMNNI